MKQAQSTTKPDLVDQRKAHLNRRQLVISLMLLMLPISFLMALIFGTIDIQLSVFINIFNDQPNTQLVSIIQDIRIPRAIMAACVGAILAICGAVTQGLFRNPLADPSLIGVTAGASTGAALLIFFSHGLVPLHSGFGLSLISIGAFIGGVITVIIVYRLATNTTGTSVATMLLAGIAITALAGGLTSILEFFAQNEMLRRISLWRMGGFAGADSQGVILALVCVFIITSCLMRFSNDLNALLLGESEARHLGIAVQSTKLKLICLVAAGVAICVALSGSIAFVGLVVPHIVRMLVGPDHRTLLPLSAVGGAILVLLADTVARTVFAPIELPVGIVTALLGAPFFVYLLRYRHSYGMQ